MKTEKPYQQPEKFIAISIIEDNAYLRAAWRAVLEDTPDFVVLGDYNTCEAAFAGEDFFESDVILIDIGLPGMTGIEGVSIIAEKTPKCAIIMITIHDDNQHIFDAVCAGAVGYLLKGVSPEALVQAIRDAHSGGSPMTPNIARKVIASFQKPARKDDVSDIHLSEQEQAVLNLLAEGKSYGKIAAEIHLSVHGVRYHLRHIYEKLHVQSRAEAVAKGLKHRLIQPPR